MLELAALAMVTESGFKVEVTAIRVLVDAATAELAVSEKPNRKRLILLITEPQSTKASKPSLVELADGALLLALGGLLGGHGVSGREGKMCERTCCPLCE